jgi:hypothetical protein
MVEDETELKKAKEVIDEAKIKTDAMVSVGGVWRGVAMDSLKYC